MIPSCTCWWISFCVKLSKREIWKPHSLSFTKQTLLCWHEEPQWLWSTVLWSLVIPKLPNRHEVLARFSLSYSDSQAKATCDKMHLKTMHTLPPDILTGVVPLVAGGHTFFPSWQGVQVRAQFLPCTTIRISISWSTKSLCYPLSYKT